MERHLRLIADSPEHGIAIGAMHGLAAARNSENVALGPCELVGPVGALADSLDHIVESGGRAQMHAQSLAAADAQIARQQQRRRGRHWRGEPLRYVERDR